MLEASRVRLPGVKEGASEAGGATGSRQGRRQERAEVEARAELRTPARGADTGQKRRWSCGRRREARVPSCGRPTEARTELRTPARGADGAADAGEEDPEPGRRRLRERAAGAGNAAATPTRSLTHSSSYPNGPAAKWAEFFSRAKFSLPRTSRPASLIGRLIVISRNLSDDKFSNQSKLIEGPYRAPDYDKDD